MQIHKFCPRGWAVSGLYPTSAYRGNRNIIIGQPISFSQSILAGKKKLQSTRCIEPSIITNPFDDLILSMPRSSLHQNFGPQVEIHSSKLCENKDRKVSFDLNAKGKSEERNLSSKSLKVNARHSRSSRRHTASYHGKENYSKKRGVCNHTSPIRRHSESELIKSASIIKDNLANIIENYLTKSSNIKFGSSPNRALKENENFTLDSIDEEYKADQVPVEHSPREYESEGNWFSNKKTIPADANFPVLHTFQASSSAQNVSDDNGSCKNQSKLIRQDSTETDIADFSLSEESLQLNNNVEQTLDILLPLEGLKGENFCVKPGHSSASDVNASLSDDSLEIKQKDEKSLCLDVNIEEADNSIYRDSLETDNGSNSKKDFEMGEMPCLPLSEEENSFSEDSLSTRDKVSSPKLDPFSYVSQENEDSSSSTPDEFSLKSDPLEPPSAELPIHWHEEFVKIFTTVNQTMSQEPSEASVSLVNTLEPIAEQDTLSKESASPTDFFKNSESEMAKNELHFTDEASDALLQSHIELLTKEHVPELDFASNISYNIGLYKGGENNKIVQQINKLDDFDHSCKQNIDSVIESHVQPYNKIQELKKSDTTFNNFTEDSYQESKIAHNLQKALPSLAPEKNLQHSNLECMSNKCFAYNKLQSFSSRDSDDRDLDNLNQELDNNGEESSLQGQYCRTHFSQDLPTDPTVYCRSDDVRAFSPGVKGTFSPVDSAPESGFASLKDSSHSEATSDSGSVIALSKSKDSFEMTDTERNHGVDNFSDDYDSVLMSGDQASKCAENKLPDVDRVTSIMFGTNTFDVDKVSIPSDQAVEACLYQKSKNFRALSLDSNYLELNQECTSDCTKPETNFSNGEKQKRNPLQKSGSEDSESHALQTSDSVSSSDTIVSKASCEEQSKLCHTEIDKISSSHQHNAYKHEKNDQKKLKNWSSGEESFSKENISAYPKKVAYSQTSNLKAIERKRCSDSELNETEPQVCLKGATIQKSYRSSIDENYQRMKDEVFPISPSVTHCRSDGNLGDSLNFSLSTPAKYKTRSVRSFYNSSSSGEFMSDRASLKSDDSTDVFTHFDIVSSQVKPRKPKKKKTLSVYSPDTNRNTQVQSEKLLHEELLNTSVNRDIRNVKDRKGKKKKKEENEISTDKKSTLASIKDFLKRGKLKDTYSKSSSPSLFRRLEKKAKGNAKSELRSDILIPSKSSEPTAPATADPLVICDISKNKSINDKTSQIMPSQGTRMISVKNTFQRNSTSIFGNKDEDNPQSVPKPHFIRTTSLNEPPTKLYKHVLTRNFSSSQESLDRIHMDGVSESERSYHSLPISINSSSHASALETHISKSAPKHFSVTIGFKPKVDSLDSVAKSRTVSVGEELNTASRFTTPSKRDTISTASSTLRKRSSSMEILVYGKIREHGSGRRRTSSGGSREGSFRLHREISVETLAEIPEGTTALSRGENENYQDYLHRVQASRDSCQNSMWSLYDNDGSCSDSQPPDSLSSQLSYADHCHSPLKKKYSLPHNIFLSGLREGSSYSNPNLSKGTSPFMRGISQSSSFTSSPYRKTYSNSSNTSPVKRGFCSEGKSSKFIIGLQVNLPISIH